MTRAVLGLTRLVGVLEPAELKPDWSDVAWGQQGSPMTELLTCLKRAVAVARVCALFLLLSIQAARQAEKVMLAVNRPKPVLAGSSLTHAVVQVCTRSSDEPLEFLSSRCWLCCCRGSDSRRGCDGLPATPGFA